MVALDRRGDVFVLSLGDGENRFTPELVAAVNEALDAVTATPEPRALVTTASGKVYSTGLDLDWVGAHPDQLVSYVGSVQALMARVLTLPVPTVAALQGHCFAAGAMFALAHDVRLMRADRGYFCLPEVDIHIPFTTGMTALIMARLPVHAAHEAMTTGRRYDGDAAQAAGIVETALPEAELVEAAVARAAGLASKHGPTLGAIKRGMYDAVAVALQQPVDLPQLAG